MYIYMESRKAGENLCGCNSIVQVPAWFIGVRVLNDHINDGKQAGKQTGREGGDVKS